MFQIITASFRAVAVIAATLPFLNAILLKELKQKLRFAEDLVDLAMRKNIQNKGKFVKEAFDLNLDVDQLEKNEEKIKQLAGETEKTNLDIYFQLDDYIKLKTGKVGKATSNVFNNIKAHLKSL